MISIRNLTKRFGSILAVDRLNLEIQQGEVFGLLGPNGAGKTTTIRLLACLIAPSSGEASINGLRIGKDNMEIRRTVGILTEAPGLYERLTAYENLAIYAHLYEVSDVKKQVDRYLRLLDLWEWRDERITSFSKGMRQRMAIARAFIHEPEVFLLDEPTATLDPRLAKTVHDFIGELKGEGRTIFLCTHNLNEAEQLCDRIGLLNQHLIALDTPENLRHQLYGRQTVVHLRSIDQAIISAVQSLDFVQGVREDDKNLIVTLTDPEEQNHVIIQKIVAAGGEIRFVTEARHSLEDVYMSVVDEGGGEKVPLTR